MLCPNCNTENPSLNILCSKCGQELIRPKVTNWSNVAKWLAFLFVIYFLGLVEELIPKYSGIRNIGMPNIFNSALLALVFLIFPVIVFYLRDIHFKNMENNLLEKVYLALMIILILFSVYFLLETFLILVYIILVGSLRAAQP